MWIVVYVQCWVDCCEVCECWYVEIIGEMQGCCVWCEQQVCVFDLGDEVCGVGCVVVYIYVSWMCQWIEVDYW